MILSPSVFISFVIHAITYIVIFAIANIVIPASLSVSGGFLAGIHYNQKACSEMNRLNCKSVLKLFYAVREILPAFIHLVQTETRLTVPPMMVLIDWRLGKKVRRVLPTILEPAPPLRRIIPRLLYLFPDVDVFSQTAHSFAMTLTSLCLI
jgi:hypothetical protein